MHKIIIITARIPSQWRARFNESLQSHQLTLLREELHGAHLDDPADDFLRVRLSVLLRREGRNIEALELLRGRTTPLAAAQHALNRLSISNGPEMARQVLIDLAELPATDHASPESLEARMRAEAAKGNALARLGEREKASASFARAGLLAELLGDKQLTALAKREFAALVYGDNERLEVLQTGLRDLAARGADTVNVHGAAYLLAESAWEDERHDLLLEALSHLPEGDPHKQAYLAFDAAIHGREVSALESNHAAYTVARAIAMSGPMLRQREAYAFAEARDTATQIINLQSPKFVSPIISSRLMLWKLLAHDVRRDFATFDREWGEVLSATPLGFTASRSFLHAIAIESLARRSGDHHDQLQHHLTELTRFFKEMNAEQTEMSASILLTYTPHALSGIITHITNPRISEMLLAHTVVIGSKGAATFRQGEQPSAREVNSHRRLLVSGNQTKIVLIRSVILTLRSLRLSPVPGTALR